MDKPRDIKGKNNSVNTERYLGHTVTVHGQLLGPLDGELHEGQAVPQSHSFAHGAPPATPYCGAAPPWLDGDAEEGQAISSFVVVYFVLQSVLHGKLQAMWWPYGVVQFVHADGKHAWLIGWLKRQS